eukprot:3311006-Prymnesium_polylepis.1
MPVQCGTKECVAVLLARSPGALELQLGRTVDLLRGEFEADELLPSANLHLQASIRPGRNASSPRPARASPLRAAERVGRRCGALGSSSLPTCGPVASVAERLLCRAAPVIKAFVELHRIAIHDESTIDKTNPGQIATPR